MLIKEFMHSDVVTITSDALLSDAQKTMTEQNVHRLPVVDGGKLVGLLTQDRINKTVKHPGIQIANPLQYLSILAEMKVKDVMETKLITVEPNSTAEYALALGQKNRVGTLLVAEGDKLVGILTTTDIYRFTSDALGLSRQGVQIHIYDCKDAKPGEISFIIGSKGVEIRSLMHIASPATGREDCLIHLDAQDATSGGHVA